MLRDGVNSSSARTGLLTNGIDQMDLQFCCFCEIVMSGLFRLIVGLFFLASNVVWSNLTVEQKHGEWLFLHYCNGCHTLKYTSYPKVSMPDHDAIKWFGVAPPDLTLSAKVRGKKWIIDYLLGFYPDNKRPFGCNNTVLPSVMMPNALFPLQNKQGVIYEQFVFDLAEFLEFVSEPEKTERYKIGIIVAIFLFVFTLIFYLLYIKKQTKSSL